MYLSKLDGKPIARTIDCFGNSEVIFISNKDDKSIQTSIDDILDEVVPEDKLSLQDQNVMRSAIMDHMYLGKPLPVSLKGKFEEVKRLIAKNNSKSISFMDACVLPIPNPDERQCIYVGGPSGSGKSTWTSMYAREWKKMFPGNKVYVFSRLIEDKVIDKIKPIRIMIDDDLVNDPIEPVELKDSLVIFDDCDTIQDDAQKRAIVKLRDDILETGRHHNIYIIVTSHLLSNNRNTKTPLNEAHIIVVFPYGGSKHQIEYTLKCYWGLDKAQVTSVLKSPSRWLAICKNYPMYVMNDREVYLL